MTALSVVQEQEPEQGIEELSTVEMTELNQLETVIEKNLRGFYEVGTALKIIRDSRLYRKSHATFEDYCNNKWDMTRRYADLQIGASQVFKALNENNCSQIPINESQVRPLTNLETEQLQQQAWEKAVETAPKGKVTGDHVHSVVYEMIHPNSEESQGETRPLCEKCRRRKVEKNSKNGLCTRCRKEEVELKRTQEAQAEWDKEPIDPESQEFWTEAHRKLEALLSSSIPMGKISEDLLNQVYDFRNHFNSYIDFLIENSVRPSQGGG